MDVMPRWQLHGLPRVCSDTFLVSVEASHWQTLRERGECHVGFKEPLTCLSPSRGIERMWGDKR